MFWVLQRIPRTLGLSSSLVPVTGTAMVEGRAGEQSALIFMDELLTLEARLPSSSSFPLEGFKSSLQQG